MDAGRDQNSGIGEFKPYTADTGLSMRDLPRKADQAEGLSPPTMDGVIQPDTRIELNDTSVGNPQDDQSSAAIYLLESANLFEPRP